MADPTMGDETRAALNEFNDCSVRAIANACCVPYARAHEAMTMAHRYHRKGAYWSQVLAALDYLGVRYSLPFNRPVSCSRDRIGYNTKEFARSRPVGRWIVSTYRHYTALVGGSYSDHIASVQRARAITGAVHIHLETEQD